MLDEIKCTTGSREEILMIFRAAKDDRTDKISMKLFGKLLGEFERVNFVTECDKRIQYRYE